MIDDQPFISVVNEIDLLGFSIVPQSIIDFVEAANIISLDQDITQQTIGIRKYHKIKLPDAIIAASAMANNLTLVTHNTTDFQDLKGLTILDPYTL